MRQLLSNTGATRVSAETLQKPQAKAKSTALNQTEMFIGHSAGNDCVDVCFDERRLCGAGVASPIGSGMCASVFVDDRMLERHS